MSRPSFSAFEFLNFGVLVPHMWRVRCSALLFPSTKTKRKTSHERHKHDKHARRNSCDGEDSKERRKGKALPPKEWVRTKLELDVSEISRLDVNDEALLKHDLTWCVKRTWERDEMNE